MIEVIVAPRAPFVALTIPLKVDGTPVTIDVGAVVTTKFGVAVTTVIVTDPVSPAPVAVIVAVDPTVAGATNATAVFEPLSDEARSLPLLGMVKTVVTLSVPAVEDKAT